MKLFVFFLLCLLGFVPNGHAAGTATTPRLSLDVEKFKQRRDLCDHFRGEDSYNEERRKFLEENLKKYCVGTDRELALLKKKYKNSEVVLKALSDYEVKIEGSNDF